MPFYAIAKGRNGFQGVVMTWQECKPLVIGVQGSRYKKFPTQKEADKFAFGSLKGVKRVRDRGINVTSRSVGRNKKQRTCDYKGVQPPVKSMGSSRGLTSRASSSNMGTTSKLSAGTTGKLGTGETGKLSTAAIAKGPLIKPSLVIYTDGACENNGQSKAAAGVGVYFGADDARNISEALPGSTQTNQRAEMMAVIRALETINEEKSKPRGPVIIKSDSNYTVKGHREWMPKWKRNGWLTYNKTPVKNKDLWQRLDQEFRRAETNGKVTLVWVKGHAGELGNERADRLAVAGIR